MIFLILGKKKKKWQKPTQFFFNVSGRSAFQEGSTVNWEEVGFYLLFNQGRNAGITSNKFAI